jgi:molybdopterin-containing oxidoreductase family membrane subunit
MRQALRAFGHYVSGSLRLIAKGSGIYYAWVALLIAMICVGVYAYVRQFSDGLIVTSLRDPVSWGFYIGNFTFLVGVAAAAVVLVIPAYIYHWKPIKEVVILGESLAIAALAMCMLFVLVDMGRPDRLLHIMPFIGTLNLPSSLLAWDVLVLNAYFFLNFGVVTYLLVSLFRGREPNKKIFMPLVLLSIPMAVGIHSVTAFVYNGLAGRPYWNAALLAPRFLVSAFCSGPAIMLILLQILRRTSKIDLSKEAIWKIAELMAYAIFINLFFLGVEVFKEVYSDTHHLKHMRYLYLGLEGKTALVGWAWTSVLTGVVAFVLFLVPRFRRNIVLLNLGCVLIFLSVFIEKGIGLVVPGFTPSVMGEIYEYGPTSVEILVSVGIFGVGALMFTFMARVAIAVARGDLRSPESSQTDRA